MFKVSAAGSLMLLGEHAVVYGKQAVAAALNTRLSVCLKPLKSSELRITSALGEYCASIQSISLKAPFQYVLAACLEMAPFQSGFELIIEADFPTDLGLGSSAAVTVAVIAVLGQWAQNNQPLAQENIFFKAKAAIQRVYAKASGTDIAASLFGGVIAYSPDPFSIRQVALELPLTVLYSGYKTPTPVVVEEIANFYKTHTAETDILFNEIEAYTKAGIQALTQQDRQLLASCMNKQQDCLKRLGVSTPFLDELLQYLSKKTEISAAKISGSGKGDCLIGLGQGITLDQSLPPSYSQAGVRFLNASVSAQGLCYE